MNDYNPEQILHPYLGGNIHFHSIKSNLEWNTNHDAPPKMEIRNKALHFSSAGWYVMTLHMFVIIKYK